jgi:hypothetical protein
MPAPYDRIPTGTRNVNRKDYKPSAEALDYFVVPNTRR